jgi:hypothetical protein
MGNVAKSLLRKKLNELLKLMPGGKRLGLIGMSELPGYLQLQIQFG